MLLASLAGGDTQQGHACWHECAGDIQRASSSSRADAGVPRLPSEDAAGEESRSPILCSYQITCILPAWRLLGGHRHLHLLGTFMRLVLLRAVPQPLPAQQTHQHQEKVCF